MIVFCTLDACDSGERSGREERRVSYTRRWPAAQGRASAFFCLCAKLCRCALRAVRHTGSAERYRRSFARAAEPSSPPQPPAGLGRAILRPGRARQGHFRSRQGPAEPCRALHSHHTRSKLGTAQTEHIHALPAHSLDEVIKDLGVWIVFMNSQ